MRRGIINKLKESISKKPKLPDLIRVKIVDENLKEFNVNILNYEKENNNFKINQEKLDFKVKANKIKLEKRTSVSKKIFEISEVVVSSILVENIEAKINIASNPVLNTRIHSGEIEKLDSKVNDLLKETKRIKIKNGNTLITSIPKTYYSELVITKEKMREIGVRIKKRYSNISFEEYGVKDLFTNIPYKSIDKFIYNDKKGSLKVRYKNKFEKSELVNFVVLKNINTNELKKIII